MGPETSQVKPFLPPQGLPPWTPDPLPFSPTAMVDDSAPKRSFYLLLCPECFPSVLKMVHSETLAFFWRLPLLRFPLFSQSLPITVHETGTSI